MFTAAPAFVSSQDVFLYTIFWWWIFFAASWCLVRESLQNPKKDFRLMKCQTISPRTCVWGRCTGSSVPLIWNVRLMSSYFNDFLGSHPCPVVLVSDDSSCGSMSCVQQLRGFSTCIHKRGGGDIGGGLWKNPCIYIDIWLYICIDVRWIIYPPPSNCGKRFIGIQGFPTKHVINLAVTVIVAGWGVDLKI